MELINKYSRSFLRKIEKVCASDAFLWFVIGFFILEATWVALSFRFPMLFDERYHVGVIDYFAHHPSPVAFHQALKYDIYGNMAFSNASLYHYLMSFPYRFIVHVTHNFEAQIVFLRVLNVLFDALGLWIFAKLFREIGIKRSIINLSLFFFSIIPLFLFVAATISYDNLLLPLTAYFLLIGTRLIQTKGSVSAQEYIMFMVIGLSGSLVKFTFLPIFAIGLLYVFLHDYRKYHKRYFPKIVGGLKKVRSTKIYILSALAVLLLGMFTIRYVYPTVKYGSPIPDCKQVLTLTRCMDSGVYYATEQAIATKSSREPKEVQGYAEWWIISMASHFDSSAAAVGSHIEFGRKLPVIEILMSMSIFVGIGILLYMWRSLEKTEGWKFLMTLVVTLLGTLFIFNAMAYYSANTDLNTQTRYILGVLPVVLVMSLAAINESIGKRVKLKLVIFSFVMLLCTQGGGDIKHIVTSADGWYWPNNKIVRHLNNGARKVLDPIVKG